MKYLRHKEKGFLIPFTPSLDSAEWEVYEEPGPHDEPEEKKPPKKSKSE